MLVFLTHLSAWETGREAARRRQRAAERDPRWFSEQKKASAWKRSKRVDVDMAGPLCHTRVGNCTFVCFPLFFFAHLLFMCDWFGFQVIVSVSSVAGGLRGAPKKKASSNKHVSRHLFSVSS